MTTVTGPEVASVSALPAWQRAIRARCAHPSGRHEPLPAALLAATVPERFREMAARYPERIAVRSPEAGMTYAELRAGAERVSGALLARNGPGKEPIGLLFEHGSGAVAALLGVLFAGKPYVPLDPAYPLERLRFIVGHAGIRTVACGDACRGLAARLVGEKNLLAPDTLRGRSSGSEAVPAAPSAAPPAAPEDPVIILYTSGSTGVPKGFTQTHANIVHDVREYAHAARFCPEDRFLLVSSMSFADSLRTLYGALLTGGSLYPFNLRAHGPDRLAEWLVENRITIYRSVPTAFRQFVRTIRPGVEFPHLRLVYLSGEPAYARDLHAYRAHFPRDCLLVNRLGTGEALTYCACFFDHDTPVDGVHLPVGFSVAGKRAFLLDPVEKPDGWEGEIAVQSRFLSPGYLGQPELSAEVFLPDRSGGDERIYRSGDLGRIRRDGCLVHLGRKDFQIKIRGHRVEGAEVEQRLLTLPQVEEAAVVADQDPEDGDARLVAYLALAGDAPPTVSKIRRALAAALPDYMIPARFVVLDDFPRTHTGKLDRRALPCPSGDRPDLDTPYVPARTELERYLAAVWSEVLGIAGIGVHDPFLELGGDSLKAARIVSRVTADLDLDLEVRSLLEAPTIHDFQKVIAG